MHDEVRGVPQGLHGGFVEEPTASPRSSGSRPPSPRSARLTPEQAAHRYADGKWSVKELIGHMMRRRAHLRRIACCASRAATRRRCRRSTRTRIAKTSNADRRSLADLAASSATIRASALALAKSLDEKALSYRGTVNAGHSAPARWLFIIAGHFQHHVNILRDRYGISL